MELKEFILCAAINYNDIIVCGHRHGDCYEVLEKLVGKIDPDKLPNRDSQGFLTSENRYISRSEAWVIAKERGQIVYGLKQCDNDVKINFGGVEVGEIPKSILISENLY